MMAKGEILTAAELAALPILDVCIPQMPDKSDKTKKQTHVFNIGNAPHKYVVGDLKKIAIKQGTRTDFFEKCFLAIWYEIGQTPVPYAFREVGDRRVRSIDAGCLGFLINRNPALLDVAAHDNKGNIISVSPTTELLSKHRVLFEANKLPRVAVQASTANLNIARDAEALAPPSVVTADPLENLGFDPFLAVDDRVKVESQQVRREGQREFIKTMERIWRGQCVVTGTSVREVLDGAHIYPYGGKATNNPRNGLLLRADIHRLFDRHCISLQYDAGDLVFHVAPDLLAGEYAKFHRLRVDANNLPEFAPHQDVVRHHFEQFQSRITSRTSKP
jgi:hypothetical protein